MRFEWFITLLMAIAFGCLGLSGYYVFQESQEWQEYVAACQAQGGIAVRGGKGSETMYYLYGLIKDVTYENGCANPLEMY